MKVKIESIEEKKMTNGNPFWIVKSNGKGYYCFDKKIADYTVGDEIEVETKEKEGTDHKGNPIRWLYIQFPKEKPQTSQAKPKEKPQTSQAKAVSTDAMLLAYAKDLEIAILEKSNEAKTLQQALEEIQFIYETFKNLIGGGK